MKLLFISPYLPSEKSGHAGAKLIYQNIISLSKSHQISLATFIDRDEENALTILEKKGIEYVSLSDWKLLETHETKTGEAEGRPRKKVGTIPKMLEIIRQKRQS